MYYTNLIDYFYTFQHFLKINFGFFFKYFSFGYSDYIQKCYIIFQVHPAVGENIKMYILYYKII